MKKNCGANDPNEADFRYKRLINNKLCLITQKIPKRTNLVPKGWISTSLNLSIGYLSPLKLFYLYKSAPPKSFHFQEGRFHITGYNKPNDAYENHFSVSYA